MNPRASLIVYVLINAVRHLQWFACLISFDYDVDLALFELHPGRRGASVQRSPRYPARNSNVKFTSIDGDFVIVLYSSHTPEGRG